MKRFIRQGLLPSSAFIAMLLGMNQVIAYPSMGNDVVNFCAANDYPLTSEYIDNDCNACHDNMSAYYNGNYEVFCPEPIVIEPICTDVDADGFFVEGDVCNTLADFDDNNANAFPGAIEDCTDGIDNDGNGLTDTSDPNAIGCPVICTDMDRDGYYLEGEICGTLADFNDSNASAFPGATEDCTDGIDNDGNELADAADPNAVGCPLNCTDSDGDSYSIDGGECGPIDCDDNNLAINPAAEENCTDSIDNNCNGLIDTADMNAVACPLTCTDVDGDGSSIEGGACGPMDCDDNNDAINPASLEICDDGIDNNCNNLADTSDSVCQTNDSGDDEGANGSDDDEEANDSDDDQDSKPWWRNRSKDRDDNNLRWNRQSHNDDDDDRSYRSSSRKRIVSWRYRERDDD